MSDSFPSRAIYETGGWNDGRIGQAYDLLASVLKDRGVRTFKNELLTSLEDLDDEVGKEPA